MLLMHKIHVACSIRISEINFFCLLLSLAVQEMQSFQNSITQRDLPPYHNILSSVECPGFLSLVACFGNLSYLSPLAQPPLGFCI